jgi:hypothetical protein
MVRSTLAGQQAAHHLVGMRGLEAGVQRRQLDRQTIAWRLRGQLPQGLLIGLEVMISVRPGAGTFAQHVEAEAQALSTGLGGRAQLLRAFKGLVHRLPQHELPAQQLHRADGRGHHRLPTQALQPASRCMIGFGQQALRQIQHPVRPLLDQPV